MTSQTRMLRSAAPQLMAGVRIHGAMLALPLLAVLFLPSSASAGVPEVSGPVCVPVPGMPCPGSSSASSSGTSRSSNSSSYSSGSRSAKPSTNTILLKGLQDSLNQMTTPNPAMLQKIRNTRIEGDQAQQEAVTAQQMTEEQRRQKAQRAAEAARMKQIQDLSSALQGLPGSASSGVDLRPGGTPFFGQGGNRGDAPLPESGIEAVRAWGSSGFDTRGPLAGQLPSLPPPVSPPAPVELKEKPIPPEKLTPEIQALLKERESLRERKRAMQSSLERFEAKEALTPEDSAAMTKLRQDLAVTLNKEGFLTFSINESLP